MEASVTPAPTPVIDARPGVAAAALLFTIYGGLALTVDFPRTALGIHSDEATYYMMGHSLAADGDLTYRREDLVRVWREFPGGPSGLFLKKGSDVLDWGFMLRPPFVWFRTQPDPDPQRLFFGKSFAYPLAAAPFVKLLGTNGFLVLHALLFSLVLLAGYLFLNARSRPAVALLLSGAFVMVSVAPIYFVWISPELFNFAIVFLAYFCWFFKEVAPALAGRPRWIDSLTRPWTEAAAALLLGVATFSKPTNALLFLPLVVWQVWKRRWTRAVLSSVLFGSLTAGLFAMNIAISGEWNYQGGYRGSCHTEFPFQTAHSTIDDCLGMARNEALGNVIFDRRFFWTNLKANLFYYFVGRYSGLVAYFFPAVFALGAFAALRQRRTSWQWLVLAAGVSQILFFILTQPYTWIGDGGSVGNRYFMGPYGVFLFMIPPIQSALWALVPWIIGGVFTAALTLNPFYCSFHPAAHAKGGAVRLLPVELTNVNGLPINTEDDRAHIWFGDNPGEGDPGFLVYFLDDNAFREADKTFWVRGGSRADFIIKTDLVVRQLSLTLSTGPVPSRVTVKAAGRTQTFDMASDRTQQVFVTLGEGIPYNFDNILRHVWVVSISSRDGFVPIFIDDTSTDTRFLGVRVKPVLVP